ncbi:MAG: hypothetical protein COZ37_05765 [bacterium (Candidatus Ratteibacteria) CG_4_10_14_3_um_filter_41_18]|uniref:N-acetyltransferase domain-containing protein n=4 Tax=Candidatus Ratteibacteria TaxID=2979319 RepID=A0A2M7EAG5_9BACT|nr:MAG: hypothetical protein AUJ76_02695 [Candidatus Omnitrophica bacterium CG1_02_41_171]PIV64698.1 MAG: hypothetical protein COS11_00845 [bacterium (Candidatus Ratteibacteria) CG01_land_8_20_14_3_00_40_19]PIW34079.1 MAG: hypothetical protein COW28_01200 [bacterium (Candidatus Ratteibacteria) CG15_BIG_FIL_POST_REV_8_21_14_020_41_12]PIX76849.1 MAG: hypothetical protein COZ37_05765 [bacterium (Candidatus Ratteibacteria) CG_4_10_14_3_um_filter_41_18]PJA61807.1 MAG: hypothetical protein CO162_0438
MAEEIRVLRKDEYQKAVRFLENAYGHSANFFACAYPVVWREENFSPENISVIRENGKIASLIRLFPMNLMVGESKIKTGGIGGVATDPEIRGKGYMGQLLNYNIKKMKAEGYALSVLGGDRFRYGNFGWEYGGRQVNLNISGRSLSKAGVKPHNKVKRFSGEKEILEKIISCHEKEELRVERRKEDYELLYQKIGSALYWAEEGESFGYIDLSGEHQGTRAIEWGGDERIISSITAYLLARFGSSAMTFPVPISKKFPKILYELSAGWSLSMVNSVKIINLRKTLEGFLPQIEQRWGSSEKQEITFEIKGNKEMVTLILGKDCSIEGKKSENFISLSEKDMAGLFFNFIPATCFSLGRLFSLLNRIFPLDFYIWPLDHI